MTVKLETTHADFHGLTDAVDKARRGSVLIKVSKDALAALLRDHGKLVREFKGRGELGGIT